MENNKHIRYCCSSQPLWDKLTELGFVEKGSDSGNGTKQVRRFFKYLTTVELSIEDSYSGIRLYSKVGNSKQEKYHGLSVNKELLEHFSTKGVYST